VLLLCLTHRIVARSTGEAFDDTEEIGSCAGQAFEEEGQRRHHRALAEEVRINIFFSGRVQL